MSVPSYSETTTDKNAAAFMGKDEVDRKIPADSRKPAAPIDGSISKWFYIVRSCSFTGSGPSG